MNISFDTNTGLVPVIVQHYHTLQVLMLGYMNEEAYEKTIHSNLVCFYSRSRKELWVKGETSGNLLHLKDIKIDCDNDTLLVKALPAGPTCHTGATSCFAEETDKGFLYSLQATIHDRIENKVQNSYTSTLFQKGINKIAQKVGEEAVELVIEAKDNNRELFLGEAADLIYHYLILLKAKEVTLEEVEQELSRRTKS